MSEVKYSDIVRILKREILAGEFEEGGSFPTGLQLAERFHVSRPTINRVMTDLRAGGLVVTHPGASPRLSRFAQRATGTLGVIHPGRRYGGVLSDICDGLVRHGERQGWDVVVSEMGEEKPERRVRELVQAIQRFSDERVAGLFLQPFEYLRDEHNARRCICDELERCGMPTVLLDYDSLRSDGGSRYDLVSFDNVASGLVVGRSLLSRGARKIAFFLKVGSPPSVVDRMRGVSAAVVENGGSWSWSGNVMVGDALDRSLVCSFLRLRHPDAIVCGNDLTAVRLHEILKGVKGAERVLLAGFDNQPEASARGIVSVSHPCDKLAFVAVQTLLSRLRNPTIPVCTISIPGCVVVR